MVAVKKLIRKLKSKFMHWHRWSVHMHQTGNGWVVKCSCDSICGIFQGGNEKGAKELAWKSNVTSGNLKANYINNGVLKTEQQLGIKTS
jgi:hypothetical protein